MLPFLARSLLNNTFGGHFHHIYHDDGGGGGVRGVEGEGWIMVFCAHLWAGTKITPFKIITEWGGGESMQRKTKSKMILAPPPTYIILITL